LATVPPNARKPFSMPSGASHILPTGNSWGGRRRPAGCVRHPAEHSSANAQPKAHPRP
jgi:hypothetical protein